METHGKGLEALGTVLAVVGWSCVAIAATLGVGVLGDGIATQDIGIALALATSAVSGMALAGLGHLLRAVAQLGRNVHRLAAMVKAR